MIQHIFFTNSCLIQVKYLCYMWQIKLIKAILLDTGVFVTSANSNFSIVVLTEQ